jgi:hypothetical protein
MLDQARRSKLYTFSIMVTMQRCYRRFAILTELIQLSHDAQARYVTWKTAKLDMLQCNIWQNDRIDTL